MTLTIFDMALYSGALLILFLTPGPVWLALLSRTVSGGFAAAWPLALGVAVGDVFWPLVAVLGLAWIVAEIDGFMLILRWVACVVFIWLGINVLRHASDRIDRDQNLTRPGAWAGFVAGLVAILGNPKAILFYMGVLPGFFDLSGVTTLDILAIVALSFTIPLLGNLFFALGVDRARRLLVSPAATRNMNRSAGILLIGVGLVLPFT